MPVPNAPREKHHFRLGYEKSGPGKTTRCLTAITTPIFGYKNHVSMDRTYGFIRHSAVTDASCHDGAMLCVIWSPVIIRHREVWRRIRPIVREPTKRLAGRSRPIVREPTKRLAGRSRPIVREPTKRLAGRSRPIVREPTKRLAGRSRPIVSRIHHQKAAHGAVRPHHRVSVAATKIGH